MLSIIVVGEDPDEEDALSIIVVDIDDEDKTICPGCLL